MLAELNIVKRDITIHDNQFISVDSLIYILSECLPNTKKDDILEWIDLHHDYFNNMFPLIKVTNNRIMPYHLYAQTFFKWHDEPIVSPLQYLNHLVHGGYAEDYNNRDMLGFSKYHALMTLEHLEIQVKAKHWKDVTPYIPIKSDLDNNVLDPYTAERLQYLESVVKYLSKSKIADTESSKYPFKMEVLLQAHRYIHVLNHYSGEKGYNAKVTLFLEDMALKDERYKAVKNNKTFISEVAGFLNSETREYMSKITPK